MSAKIGLLLAVGAGGFLGAILRHLLGGWIQNLAGGKFPWGILAVNVLGCLLIGYVMAQSLPGTLPDGNYAEPAPEPWRLFLVTGVFGALTTFSAFGLDTVSLARGELPWLAVANVAANVVLGLSAVAVGMALGKA